MSPTTEGTPQGGPLSPFLSNIVLDELDRELNDGATALCATRTTANIYVRSERAGRRVMESITGFITKKLKLKVNQGEKRGGQAREAEVPGIQLYGRQRAKAAGCPSGSGPVQGAGPGPDAADANGGNWTNGQGTV